MRNDGTEATATAATVAVPVIRLARFNDAEM